MDEPFRQGYVVGVSDTVNILRDIALAADTGSSTDLLDTLVACKKL